MAISKKLPSKEKVIDDLINKGGSVSSVHGSNNAIKGFQLRLPNDLICQIDKKCTSQYGIKQSRHSWILEAILEKINRESQ